MARSSSTTWPLATSNQLSDRNGFLTRTPSIDAHGTRVTWRDSSDGNSEVYFHDTVTDTTTQVTDVASGFSEHPTISADGSRIAFESSADLGGSNPDGSDEIFLHDTTTLVTTPITSSPTASSGGPVISGSGTRVAFTGTGGGVIHDTTTSTDTTVAHGFGPGATTGFARSINGDGTHVAFDSSDDIDGTPPINHNHEIWLYRPGGTIPVTDSEASNFDPDITADGTRIVFHSTGDLVPGGNADANPEIFVATRAPPPRPDAQIATAAAGPFVGNNRYAAGVTPAQTRAAGVALVDLLRPGPERLGRRRLVEGQGDGVRGIRLHGAPVQGGPTTSARRCGPAPTRWPGWPRAPRWSSG